MKFTTWYYIGSIILILDIIWIAFYYYYATVKIYNFKQNKEYHYLGHLWIRKKRGQYYLKIPGEMIELSVTTQYKIVSQSAFHRFRKGEKLYVNFADEYQTEVRLSSLMTVKNYIATSHQL